MELTKEAIKAELQRGNNGLAFITRQGFAEAYGPISDAVARRKLKEWGCTKIDGRYYFIPEIVDAIYQRRNTE